MHEDTVYVVIALTYLLLLALMLFISITEFRKNNKVLSGFVLAISIVLFCLLFDTMGLPFNGEPGFLIP
jgi:high-affinity Fe2+/Pb2+ permease